MIYHGTSVDEVNLLKMNYVSHNNIVMEVYPDTIYSYTLDLKYLGCEKNNAHMEYFLSFQTTKHVGWSIDDVIRNITYNLLLGL